MTHEERECEQQRVRAMASVMSMDVLRRARAKLLDVAEASDGKPAEVVVLRGEVVHAEIQRRESGEGAAGASARVARQLWTGTGAEWVDALARTDTNFEFRAHGVAPKAVRTAVVVAVLAIAGLAILSFIGFLIEASSSQHR